MAWNPFKRKSLTGTPAVLDSIRGGNSLLTNLGSGQRQRIEEAFQTAKTANYAWMYRNSPAVRTVIDTIARNVGQLDLRLYEEISEAERQPRPDHPAALSLRYPSETVPSDQFIRSLFKDYLTSGDAVALMLPTTGGQIVFKWVPISLVQFLGTSMFDTDVYRVTELNQGLFRDFPAENILHWHGEDPQDPRTGLSHLETLRNVIAEDAALQQATVELAQSGLVNPFYIYRPLEAPPLSNDAREGLEEDVANRMRRATRRPFALEEGSEMRGLGVSPRDAQMLEVRRWAIAQIAAEFGVPAGMVGLDDAHLAEAQSSFYSDTLPPYCEEFTKMLNQRILVRVYDQTTYCFEFNLDEKHMGDDRITSLVSGSGRAVFTTNEARAKLNLPPVDTGDELVTPMNVIVGDNPKPSPQIMGPQDPNGPAQDGSARSDDPPAPNAPKALAKAVEYEPIQQLVPARKADLERQHGHIDLAQAAVQRHFNRLGRSLRQKAATDWDRWDREFSDDLHRVVKQIAETEGTIFAFKLAGEFDMRKVQNYLRAMAEGAAEGINAKIREEITDLGLDGALARGSQHVASSGAGIGAAATRWSREEAARQSGGTEHRVKVWIADTQRHAEFDGDAVPLGDDWPAGFAPGSAPGCRCSMTIQ